MSSRRRGAGRLPRRTEKKNSPFLSWSSSFSRSRRHRHQRATAAGSLRPHISSRVLAGVKIQPEAVHSLVAVSSNQAMDLDTENRLATLLLEEARRLQLEADKEGVHAYLRKPNVRHRPNSRFLTATVRGVQQANRVVEVDEMWRAREKELELESKMKIRYKGHTGSRGGKRKGDSDNQSSSSKIEEGIAYNSCYSDQEDGLGDDEVEKFLHSRVKRGRGAIGSRMDESGPYLKASVHCQDNEPSADTRLEEKWERRVQGPERPLFLRSKFPDDCWHRENLDGEPSSSEPHKKNENRKEKKSEKKERKERKDKKKSKHRHHHHHHHKSRRRE